MKIKINPQFNFNKYDFGFAFILSRENESKKYTRKHKVTNYIFGIAFLWFSFGIEIELRWEND